MFHSPNDCFLSSPSSSSNVVFTRPHYASRYHPYHRNPTSYYSTNQSPSYAFDNNSHSLAASNYDQSMNLYDYNMSWTTSSSSIENEPNAEQIDITAPSVTGKTGVVRCLKRRVSANKKERRRTQSINTAFSDLRTAIPNVQPDTKLSKIKTLKLATKYIEFLMDILSKDDPTAMPSAFKAEIVKTRKDHRDLMKLDNSSTSRKGKGRTGWPQAVWQSELNRNESLHHNSQSSMGSDFTAPPFASSIKPQNYPADHLCRSSSVSQTSPSSNNKLTGFEKSHFMKQAL